LVAGKETGLEVNREETKPRTVDRMHDNVTT